MSAPSKLSQKAFYWGPLFVGVICFVAGAVLVRSSTDFEFGDRYADYQSQRDAMLARNYAELPPLKTENFEQSGLIGKQVTGPNIKPDELSTAKDRSSLKKERPEDVEQPLEKLQKETAPTGEADLIISREKIPLKDNAPKSEELNKKPVVQTEAQAALLKQPVTKTEEPVESLKNSDAPAEEASLKKDGVSAKNLPIKKPFNSAPDDFDADRDEIPFKAESEQQLALAKDLSRDKATQTKRRPPHAVLPSVVVAQDAETAGFEGGEALAGLNQIDKGFEKLKISQYSEAIAQMGLISKSIADKLVERSVIFTARREATAFGLGGKDSFSGLQFSDRSHSRPLVLHQAAAFGVAGSEAMKGLLHTDNAIIKLARQELIAGTVEVGSGPLFVQTGIATSLEGAALMQQRYKLAVAGRNIAIDEGSKSYAGVKVALKDASKLAQKTGDQKTSDKISSKVGVDLAVLGHMNKDSVGAAARLGAHEDSQRRCSENFYNSLKALNELKIASLSSVVKPISRIDKALPGRWIFKPSVAGVKRVCSRYKRYYSGRKKCIRWKKQVQPIIVTGGPDQKAFFKVASGLIAGKGRHPILKSRSPGHWVVNRVARDLKIYSHQKPHPAICTGALGMVNYFEGNLKKVSLHIAEVEKLSNLSGEFLNYWQGELLKTLKENRDDDAAQTGRNGRELSIEEQLDRIANQRHLTVFKEDFDISAIDLPLALGQVASKIFGAEAAVEIRASEDFIFALSESRKQLQAHRKRLPKRLYAVLHKFYSTVEASHYIRRSQERYQPLKEQLFGSLRDIRSAHQTHCVCQN